MLARVLLWLAYISDATGGTILTGLGENMLEKREQAGEPDTGDFAGLLLGWYDWSARKMPWRTPPGVRPDPYKVWLSEIMLQQTTVKAVSPYYTAFVERWPDVRSLAAADQEDVLRMWAGLGYYSRARNLHLCAGEVVAFHGGRFPETEEALMALPGIGAYTAAAIVAIAFDRPATVVDGNVERVVARLFAVETLLPEAKPELRRLAATITVADRPGDYAQAMMDLGATVCTPRKPACLVCPVAEGCLARKKGIAELLPNRESAPDKPRRRGTAFFALRSDGTVLLRKRPEKGLLGGMSEVPSGPWREEAAQDDDALTAAPLEARWTRLDGTVRHTFTHFHLELEVYYAMVQTSVPLKETASPESCRWVKRRDLDAEALPSLMRKVIAHALESGIGKGGFFAR